MKYNSVFDIIGPIMIGPSSSHTAGAARIGKIARNIFSKEPKWAKIYFYGSFAQTHKGHGTDEAIVGGILDFETDDVRIIDSLRIAEEKQIKIEFFEETVEAIHPNTARIAMGDDDNQIEMVGVSIGGGTVEITEMDGFKLSISGQLPVVMVLHYDRYGTIASVSNVLAAHQVNIGHMEVSRHEKGKQALMTIEVDQNVSDEIVNEIRCLDHIVNVSRITS